MTYLYQCTYCVYASTIAVCNLQMDATFRSVALIQNYSEATRNPLKIV